MKNRFQSLISQMGQLVPLRRGYRGGDGVDDAARRGETIYGYNSIRSSAYDAAALSSSIIHAAPSLRGHPPPAPVPPPPPRVLAPEPLIPPNVVSDRAPPRGESVGKYTPDNKPPVPPKKPFAIQGDAAKAEAALQKANPVVGDAVKKVAASSSAATSGEASEGVVKSAESGMIAAHAALPYAATAPRATRAGAPDGVPIPINEQATGGAVHLTRSLKAHGFNA
jgi:hypothetical protein